MLKWALTFLPFEISLLLQELSRCFLIYLFPLLMSLLPLFFLQMHRQMNRDKKKTVTLAPILAKSSSQNSNKPEMLVSLMRHYQNSFQDTGKQDAMNLYLGYFVPSRSPDAKHIWDLESDFYLHNRSPHEKVSFKGEGVAFC
jgi:hypothetical protein